MLQDILLFQITSFFFLIKQEIQLQIDCRDFVVIIFLVNAFNNMHMHRLPRCPL